MKPRLSALRLQEVDEPAGQSARVSGACAQLKAFHLPDRKQVQVDIGRADFAKRGYVVQYFDAKKDSQRLKELLSYSNNVRRVPVIVEDGRVTIGFGGT
jgi:hypothetical protein